MIASRQNRSRGVVGLVAGLGLLVLSQCGTDLDASDCSLGRTCVDGAEVGLEAGLVDGSDAAAGNADVRADGEADAPADGLCGATGLICDGGCTGSDVHNCGACGHDCAKLANVTGAVSCSTTGACVLGPSSCAPEWADCDGNPENGCETDITQPSHCGSCGMGCPMTAPLCQRVDGGLRLRDRVRSE